MCQTSKKNKESHQCSSRFDNRIKKTTYRPKDTRVSNNQDHRWHHRAIAMIICSPRECKWVNSRSNNSVLGQIAVSALLLKFTHHRVAKRALIFLVGTTQENRTPAHLDSDLSHGTCSTRLVISIRLLKFQNQLTTLDQTLSTNRTKLDSGSSNRTNEALWKFKSTKTSPRQPFYGLRKPTSQTDLTESGSVSQVLSAWLGKI